MLTYHGFEMIDQVRDKLAKLLKASKEELIFTSGATESMCLIANGLKPIVKPGDEIILTDGEHTSNLLPWMELAETSRAKLVYAKNAVNGIPTENSIIKAITKHTKIIAFADVSNLLGYELDVAKIEKAAHAINKQIIIIVDATQSMPHKPIDLKKTKIDFMVCSGHKMLAGTGIGLCFISKSYLN
ncbi:hypothetical protein FACS1894218_6230 [Bacilli bacterium]|nr:hypothetical protein FACS1894218_6230 [Bacilli bacterium]